MSTWLASFAVFLEVYLATTAPVPLECSRLYLEPTEPTAVYTLTRTENGPCTPCILQPRERLALEPPAGRAALIYVSGSSSLWLSPSPRLRSCTLRLPRPRSTR